MKKELCCGRASCLGSKTCCKDIDCAVHGKVEKVIARVDFSNSIDFLANITGVKLSDMLGKSAR